MKDCEHHFVFCKKEKTGGGYMLKKQCAECGKSDSFSYKFTEVGGKDQVLKLPDFDDDMLNSYYEGQQKARLEKYKKERQDFFEIYSQYLLSSKWRRKREAVLKRDNYICKACETNKAEQVHHLSYQFVFDEPLFDLVSVCKKCHDKIEKMKLEQKGIE